MRQLLLILFFLAVAPVALSQQLLDKEVSITFKNTGLEKSLSQLEKSSGVTFSYNSRQIGNIRKRVDHSFSNAPIRSVLDYLLTDTRIQYEEIGGQITLFELSSNAEKVILSGYIRERSSGEELIGARVFFPELGIGCISNSYGYYALEVPKGETFFRATSLGMLALNDSIRVEDEMVFNIQLSVDTLLLTTVEVVSDGEEDLNVSDLPGLDETIITQSAIAKIPAASGERDLLRHIQQFPGIQPSNDGGVNYQVRGSGTGGNLILLDEIPIYHPTHLLGIYSIINTDALKSATLYKDYIPLQYGSRSSSVLKIHTREGNLNDYHISGGFSGFMARLNLEGPIIKKKASFYASSRVSTFPGALLNIVTDRQLWSPSFYDFNGKVNIHLNSNNRIYLTGYFGRDRLQDSTSNYTWGNLAGSFRWNRVINSKTFSNLSVIHSEFAYGYYRFRDFEQLSFGQKVITDKVTYDITNFFSNSMKINVGISAAVLRTNKGNFSDKTANLFLQRTNVNNGIYGSVEKKFSRRFKMSAGIRIPFSFHIGTGDTTAYLNQDFSLSQVIYQKNKFYDPIFFVDPRLVASYRLTENDEIQLASMVTSQNTHIINYINYFLPIEIWTPSTAYLKPERNFQTSLGWTHIKGNLHTSAVIYQKFVNNVLDYASPVFTSSTDIESNLLAGKLNVRGIELMLNYRFTTWYSASVSYAYTRTRQEIKGINNDEPYVAPGDRPHYFSFSQFFNLTKKWQMTTNYTIHSGTAITLPNGQFTVGGTAFPLYSDERNTERLPQFRRLDLSFRRQLGVKKKKDNWNLVFTITNFFNRYNPSVAYVDHDIFDPQNLVIRTADYSPFMVSLNINFKF